MDQQGSADDNFILAIGVLISAAIGLGINNIIIQIACAAVMMFSMIEIGIIASRITKYEY
jgi:hypothetical protein